MAQPLSLIVGLGNPEKEYAMNRHNVGFMVVDALSHSFNATKWQKKYKSEIAQADIDGVSCILIKPMTYMNLSGEAVGEIMRFYKLTPEDVFVFHDDLDLPPGDVRVKQGGGNAGHNGLKSLDAHIGANYWRVRIGIGRPENKDQVSDYVLSNFSKADVKWIEKMLDGIVNAMPQLLEKNASAFLKAVSGQ